LITIRSVEVADGRENMTVHIPVDRERIRKFCSRWKIAELALSGSVLPDDFRADGDVDVLVAFAPDAR